MRKLTKVQWWYLASLVALLGLGTCWLAGQVLPISRGLLGLYYTNAQWQGEPAFTTVDETIGLDTVFARRLVFPEKHYSVSWSGWLQVPQSGAYTFELQSDDGSNLFLDGELLLDNGGFHALRTQRGQIELEAGFHRLDIGYFQGEARDELIVTWQPPGAEISQIPKELLFQNLPAGWRLWLEPTLPWIFWGWTVFTISVVGLTGVINRRHLRDFLLHAFQSFRIRVLNAPALKIWGIATLILLGVWGGLVWERSRYGLSAHYYPNLDWRGEAITLNRDTDISPSRIYRRVARPQHANSLRWTGWLHVPEDDTYTLAARTDGILNILIDDTSVLRKENNDRIQYGTTALYLTAGLHPLDIRYRPATGSEHVLELVLDDDETTGRSLPATWLFANQPDASALKQRRIFVMLRTFTGGVLVIIIPLFILALWTNQAQVAQTSAAILKKCPGTSWLQATRNILLRSKWAHFTLILTFSALIIFQNLGRGSIITSDFDEGMHTRVAQYMAKSGIWWALYEAEGKPYYNKPPLKIWLSAATIRLLGDSEGALRMWDAIFGVLTLLMVYHFGTRLFHDRSVGLLAALMLLGCQDFILHHSVRTGVMDSLMLFFFTASLYCFWFRKERASYYYLAGVCLGLGALTKSVQALAPLAIFVLYLLFTRQHAELISRPFLTMTGLAFLFPMAWYLPHFFFSPGFFQTSVVEQIFHRVQGKIHPLQLHGPFFFFGSIYRGFFPWSLLTLPVIGAACWRKQWRQQPEVRFLLIWVLTIFIGFSFSKMKVVWYMNPLYPGLTLLMAYIFISGAKLLWMSRKYPLLAPALMGMTLLFTGWALAENYQRVTAPVEKIPMHIFVDYLADVPEDDYRVVLYDIDELENLDHAARYYLDRIPESHIIRTNDVQRLRQVLTDGVPLFVLLNVDDYDHVPLFREHDYQYWLAPVYTKGLYPKQVILVYNYHPDNAWFIQN